jgi:hypothetical protein
VENTKNENGCQANNFNELVYYFPTGFDENAGLQAKTSA